MRRLTLFAIAAALAVGLSIPAAASATTFIYSLAGTGTATPGGCLDCTGPTMDATGTATCSVCAPGKPESGTFTIKTNVTTHPPSPCKLSSVSGTLEVIWSDASISNANVSGKLRDSKALALAGAFYPGDPTFPGDPMKVLLNNFPSRPCLAASNAITGTLAISTG
jgi:hypothetical protein